MRGIAFKLWLGMVLLVIVMLVLLWLFQIVFLGRFYTDQQVARVKNEGFSIAREIDKLNPDDIKSRMGRLADNYRSKVDLFDSKGVIIHSEGQAPIMHGGFPTGIINKILEGDAVTIPIWHPRFGTEFRLIGIPVTSKGAIAGALFINMPLAPVKDTVGILKNQLVYITLLLVTAALILAYILSRVFTRPIIQIDNAANQMAKGDLSVRLNPRSGDELGRLMKTMNNLAEQLSRVEELRRDLIANVSHELRTPLSLIRGYAETIKDVSGDNREKREKQLDVIIDETERLSKIVDDMLNLSQIQAGYITLTLSSFKVSELISRVIKKYEIMSEATGVNLEFLRTEEYVVDADEIRIEQVLINLLNNAFNHTPKGGRITLAAFERGSFIRIEVSDTGDGIPSEDIKYIWERFYKVEKSKRSKQAGTGLGLAIVKNILEAHNVSFGVESQIGKGTTFWFELAKAA